MDNVSRETILKPGDSDSNKNMLHPEDKTEVKTAAQIAEERSKNGKIEFKEVPKEDNSNTKKNVDIKTASPEEAKKYNINQAKGEELCDDINIFVGCKKILDKEAYKWRIPGSLKDANYLLLSLKFEIEKRLKKENSPLRRLVSKVFGVKINELGRLVLPETPQELELSINSTGKVVIPKDLRYACLLFKLADMAIQRQMMSMVMPIQGAVPTSPALGNIAGQKMNRSRRRQGR